jgi:hypothetical protein
MTRRDKIALETEFHALLISCLERCSRGRWGLLGTFDHLGEARKYWAWPEADHLRELAILIEEILARSGQANALCSEFLRLCKHHGQNDPGEPKMAQAFLVRIGNGEFGQSVLNG